MTRPYTAKSRSSCSYQESPTALGQAVQRAAQKIFICVFRLRFLTGKNKLIGSI